MSLPGYPLTFPGPAGPPLWQSAVQALAARGKKSKKSIKPALRDSLLITILLVSPRSKRKTLLQLG